MTKRRDVLKVPLIGAALLASPLVIEGKSVASRSPLELGRKAIVTRLRFGLIGSDKARHPDDENHYWVEAVQDQDRFYFRAKGVTIETPAYRYRSVMANPYLYCFSSALWLHQQILGETKRRGASA